MRTIASGRTVVVAALLALGIAACGDEAALSSAEDQLEDAYLAPLDDAGIAYDIVEHCAGQLSGEAVWHLSVTLDVDAPAGDVADALADTVDVIDRSRDPMLLQQRAGEPNRGWNGLIERGDEQARLGIVKNNVDVGDDGPDDDWPECRGLG